MRDRVAAALIVAGMASVVGGLYLVWPPLSVIAFGGFLLYAGVKIALSDTRDSSG